MAYNFEEQEQLDSLKAFWGRWGSLILTVITVIALAVAGSRLWGWYQNKAAADAANAYGVLQTAAEARDMSRVRAATQTLRDSHGGSIYAPMGALVAAKAHVDARELDAAAAELRWIIDKAGTTEFAPIARLRLAGLLLDQGKAEQGLGLLDRDTLPKAFRPLADDRRGDLLAALARRDEAIAAWEVALAELPAGGPLRRTIELKRDSLKAQAAS